MPSQQLSQSLQHFFKPEVRSQGATLVAKGLVSLSVAGDTQVVSYVRTSTPYKVTFTAESIASPHFTAMCSCSSFSKGQSCKHIWATLLNVETSFPDFLDTKKDFALGSPTLRAPPAAQKQKAAEYRKQRYDAQKAATKQAKTKAKVREKLRSPVPGKAMPEAVQEALRYFDENGFALELPIDLGALRNAKKLLARVFHPDKGGTHEEILTLNRNFDLLCDYEQS